MSDYIAWANSLNSTNGHEDEVAERMAYRMKLIHACMGLTTEVGEVTDAVKKALFYGRPLDRTNIKEELGDIFWYLALFAEYLGEDFEEIMAANKRKLTARYGDKWDKEREANRDLEAEAKEVSTTLPTDLAQLPH